MAMDRQEAERLATQINNEAKWAWGSQWHAEAKINSWTGGWYVKAWQGDTEEDEENNSYTFEFKSSWFKTRQGLWEEQRDAREEKFLKDWEEKLVKQGYSREWAAESAVWELHVRNGGD